MSLQPINIGNNNIYMGDISKEQKMIKEAGNELVRAGKLDSVGHFFTKGQITNNDGKKVWSYDITPLGRTAIFNAQAPFIQDGKLSEKFSLKYPALAKMEKLEAEVVNAKAKINAQARTTDQTQSAVIPGTKEIRPRIEFVKALVQLSDKEASVLSQFQHYLMPGGVSEKTAMAFMDELKNARVLDFNSDYPMQVEKLTESTLAVITENMKTKGLPESELAFLIHDNTGSDRGRSFAMNKVALYLK